MQRFWSVEEVPESVVLEPKDEACEKLFRETHSRDPSGRYVVCLTLQSLQHLQIYTGALKPNPTMRVRIRCLLVKSWVIGMSRIPKEEIDNPHA